MKLVIEPGNPDDTVTLRPGFDFRERTLKHPYQPIMRGSGQTKTITITADDFIHSTGNLWLHP